MRITFFDFPKPFIIEIISEEFAHHGKATAKALKIKL